jgi:hypothetical protein
MAVLTDTVTDALQSVLISPWQSWLSEHPIVAWLVIHPLWALALIGLGLLLFAGLWSAIARLTEGFWLMLVRLPFQLGGWFFLTSSSLLVNQWTKSSQPADPPNRLSEIITQLERLQAEQEGLLAEIRELLTERH